MVGEAIIGSYGIYPDDPKFDEPEQFAVTRGNVWIQLCVKSTDDMIILSDQAAHDDADSAAWHINKSTGRPTRFRRLGDKKYAVDILLE